MMKCLNCGKELLGNEIFCSNCGNNVLSSKMKKRKQRTIVFLLSIIVILLSIIAVMVSIDDNVIRLDDGTRTIMIYMVGSNLESENKIATYDIDAIDADLIDLDKMTVLLYTGGTKEWHNFIKNDENAIYVLTDNGFEKIETYEMKNMGDADTLQEFLDYSYSNYKSEYYDLILYNHGGAIDGAIYDDFTDDNLSLEDFDVALDNSKFSSKNKLDTILFRTCLNGTLEVANVLAPYANYLIASEEITNGGKSSVLNFLNEIDEDDDAVSYGKKYIRAYEKQIDDIDPLGFGTKPMYAIIDLNKIPDLWETFSKYIETVDLKNNYSDIVKIRSKMYQYGYTSFNIADYDTVDLYTLIDKIAKYATGDSDEVLNKISDAIVYNWTRQEDSHGLSVYFPYKADKKIQDLFLKVYKKLNNTPYYEFIGNFNNLSTSNKNSAFSNFGVGLNESKVVSREFTLQLTNEQVRDYADAIYIIFRRTDDGKYNPIYSSDNTELSSDGVIKTKLENNLIKLIDLSDGEENYLTVIERNNNGEKVLLTNAVLFNYSSDDISDWKTVGATVYFDTTASIPKIANYVDLDSNKDKDVKINGVTGNIINSDDYETISFISSNYEILDQEGNYTDNWDNEGVISGYEVKLKNMGFKYTSLDNDDYYCIFKIYDIYGNVYYSPLLSVD